ncbi:UDP-N-acetylmuramoylpentapeptide-lysine N(6)-alanyltransferase [Fructilactobacillus sanfranciscensis]|uniref:UDP-N-acetylmuramoylpentapeptide-lysine N(6)-alanyltransferase n=1 Tax=Fructilactobacillus sanfranciscensis TaxID=1625 RepID=UPI0013D53EBD|nr:peptidoglycan bridge formation glycyltransferase FemA/FemB family protein [Fructilactobacillus sanfranciscensis]MDN4462675.1 peptidoglycan bridge formation glycyltransferase FemA/FemB family protein [Fructilactobacillus sanfranciscensis]NDR62089.1 peptidoglycan bridge formation glycyltransferase FemA/FemB family protein [Fructilactobacillus sanfranciscensis]
MPVLDQKDKEMVARYEKFMRSTKEGRLTQDLGWAKVKNNWESREVFVENENGEIVAAMSMLLTDTPAGKKFAYASKGPIIADRFDLDLLDKLVAEAKKILPDAYVLRMDPEIEYSDELNDELKKRGYKTRNRNVADEGMHATIQPRLNMVLDLANFPGKEKTLDLYPSKTKSKLKRPIRDGVEATWGHDAAAIDAFYTTYQTMANRHGITYRPKEYFQRMLDAFDENTMRIYVAKRDGELLSTGIVLKYGDKIWYVYAGSMDGNTYYAPYAVQTEMIQWALDEPDITLYDMGGIESESTSDPLWVFKHTFVKAAPVEYIGEIDAVLDDDVYKELVKD